MAHATARSSSKECAPPPSPARIWWSNGIFFVAMHLAAVVAVALRPPSEVPRATLVFMVAMWQAASMGITVGYHRLYSHRAFRATWPARAFLAILGAGGFQGSIKWWCLRHRLHHRFTDDPAHDPYAATKGLLWSHMGWIFYKSRYEKLESIDRDDLEDDIVVRLQHEYYIPLALLTGFVMPPVVGLLWSDPVGSFVYAGLVARLLIWHCTFFVNSLAHWDGLQPYSDDNTSKSNLVLALLTCGEGNHNFHHSFPHDFRSGPSSLDWDPSKWAIMLLHSIGLASGLRRAELEEIKAAREHMLEKKAARMSANTFVGGDAEVGDEGEAESTKWDGSIWTAEQAAEYANTKHRCVLLLDGYAVDATEYLAEHPGGTSLLRRYAIGSKAPKRGAPLQDGPARDADWAFHGGINKHSQAARRRMRRLRVAKVQVQVQE